VIRINLLKGRVGPADLLPPALDASGAPARFLTKREFILALAVVMIGGAIIAAQVFGIFSEPVKDDPLVATYERPVAPEPKSAVQPVIEEAQAAPPDIPNPVSAPVPEQPPPTKEPTAVVPAPAVRPDAEFGAPPAHTVTAIKLVPWGEAIEVLAEVQGQPEYRSFWLTNPDRLVLDVEDSELHVAASELTRQNPHPLIRQLRAAQNSFEPPLVRIVVETERDGPVEITSSAAGISVKLSPAP
jgi:AMIN domain